MLRSCFQTDSMVSPFATIIVSSCDGRHNNGMHPARDTLPVSDLNRAGGRVTPGAMLASFMILRRRTKRGNEGRIFVRVNDGNYVGRH